MILASHFHQSNCPWYSLPGGWGGSLERWSPSTGITGWANPCALRVLGLGNLDREHLKGVRHWSCFLSLTEISLVLLHPENCQGLGLSEGTLESSGHHQMGLNSEEISQFKTYCGGKENQCLSWIKLELQIKPQWLAAPLRGGQNSFKKRSLALHFVQNCEKKVPSEKLSSFKLTKQPSGYYRFNHRWNVWIQLRKGLWISEKSPRVVSLFQ